MEEQHDDSILSHKVFINEVYRTFFQHCKVANIASQNIMTL